MPDVTPDPARTRAAVLALAEWLREHDAGFEAAGRERSGTKHRPLPGATGLPTADLAGVDDPGDVLAADLHRGAPLLEEAGHGLAVGHDLRQEELHRDPLVELQVRRRHHHAHPARAEHPLDPVFPGEHLAELNGRLVHRGRLDTDDPRGGRQGYRSATARALSMSPEA